MTLKIKYLVGSGLMFVSVASVWAGGYKPAAQGAFTQADLETIVKELDAVLPHNEDYLYPVASSIVEKDELNAYATIRKETGQTKPRAVMVVFSGLIKDIKGDKRLIRAVVAHELSHLSLGHSVDLNPAARDVKNLWTRQQEFEADKSGAIALQRSGHTKNDMVDMLLFLDKQRGRNGVDWLGRLTADHADPKARAAEVSENPAVLKALCTFDVALAFFDNRNYLLAMNLFDSAAMQEPKLTEAYINAGKSGLMFYYDNIGSAFRDTQWWRPDFGPILVDTSIGTSRDPQISDDDKERYNDAMERITKALVKAPNNLDAQENLALAQILEPMGDKATVQKGVDWFKSHIASTSDAAIKLRYANNAGVGLKRNGDLQGAFDTIIAVQKTTDVFNPAVGENLGRLTINNASPEMLKLAASVVYTWLSDTPNQSPNWKTVKGTFDDLVKKGGFSGMEVKQKPTYLCKVVSLNTGGKELGILVPETNYYDALGKADVRITFTDRFPDLAEIRWAGGDVAVFTEKGNIMRVTTYQPGAYLMLRPSDTTISGVYLIKNGMTKADLENILNPKAGVQKDLAKGGKTEVWTYYPGMKFGVMYKDDKVAGLTVTAIQAEEE